MKFLILSVLLFAGAFAAPLEEPRWNMAPDGEGNMHLIDTDPIEMEPEPLFNAGRDVFYVLFTRRNTLIGQRITASAASITGSNWNNGNGARFIIHGWLQSATTSLNVIITRGYLNAADLNVVRVDWNAGARSLNYLTARGRVDAVGATVASFIDWLHQNGRIPSFAQVIIAGHSLGAHAAGHAGKRVSRGRIQAIFGLDPAGPMFTVGNSAGRFHETDAVYTEMIATNAGDLGFDRPIAHANFYPNWGSSQPGCLLDSCHHDRSNEFYAESITSNRFVARQCSSFTSIQFRSCPAGQGTAIMGGNASKTARGVFYLETNRSSPFARG